MIINFGILKAFYLVMLQKMSNSQLKKPTLCKHCKGFGMFESGDCFLCKGDGFVWKS